MIIRPKWRGKEEKQTRKATAKTAKEQREASSEENTNPAVKGGDEASVGPPQFW